MKPETTLSHFIYGVFFAPASHGHAIEGAHGSRAIGPVLAVDEDRRAFWIGGDLQKPRGFFLLGMPRLHVDVFIRKARIVDFMPVRVEGAQIDDGFNPKSF